MEVEKPPAAAEMVGEVTEVTTEVLKKEESAAEPVVTTVTADAVGSFDETSETEDKEPEDTGKIEEEEKERICSNGGEEEEQGRGKKSLGSEVRTCLSCSVTKVSRPPGALPACASLL